MVRDRSRSPCLRRPAPFQCIQEPMFSFFKLIESAVNASELCGIARRKKRVAIGLFQAFYQTLEAFYTLLRLSFGPSLQQFQATLLSHTKQFVPPFRFRQMCWQIVRYIIRHALWG